VVYVPPSGCHTRIPDRCSVRFDSLLFLFAPPSYAVGVVSCCRTRRSGGLPTFPCVLTRPVRMGYVLSNCPRWLSRAMVCGNRGWLDAQSSFVGVGRLCCLSQVCGGVQQPPQVSLGGVESVGAVHPGGFVVSGRGTSGRRVILEVR
jgi:hypothetical protein